MVQGRKFCSSANHQNLCIHTFLFPASLWCEFSICRHATWTSKQWPWTLYDLTIILSIVIRHNYATMTSQCEVPHILFWPLRFYGGFINAFSSTRVFKMQFCFYQLPSTPLHPPTKARGTSPLPPSHKNIPNFVSLCSKLPNSTPIHQNNPPTPRSPFTPLEIWNLKIIGAVYNLWMQDVLLSCSRVVSQTK